MLKPFVVDNTAADSDKHNNAKEHRLDNSPNHPKEKGECIVFQLGNVELARLHNNSAWSLGKCSAIGDSSIAGGVLSTADGIGACALGTCCRSLNTSSFSCGISCEASGIASHSTGIDCIASGQSSRVMGHRAYDNGRDFCFVWGDGTVPTEAGADYQFVARSSGGVKFIVEGNIEINSTEDGSWNYNAQCPEHWKGKPPQSVFDAIDRLSRAYYKQKGPIPE